MLNEPEIINGLVQKAHRAVTHTSAELSQEVSIVFFVYPLSYGVPVRERYGSALLPATREQHDQNCTQSH